LTKVYETKVADGDLDAIAFIQGLSPVAWQHVNMFGSFELSDEEQGIDLEALVARYADSVLWSNATQPGQGDLFD
jgi:hypothetical protein